MKDSSFIYHTQETARIEYDTFFKKKTKILKKERLSIENSRSQTLGYHETRSAILLTMETTVIASHLKPERGWPVQPRE